MWVCMYYVYIQIYVGIVVFVCLSIDLAQASQMH